MTVLTRSLLNALPASATRVVRVAEDRGWSVAVRFVNEGTDGLPDTWRVSLRACTDRGEASLDLAWDRMAGNFRYKRNRGSGVVGTTYFTMTLSDVQELLTTAKLAGWSSADMTPADVCETAPPVADEPVDVIARAVQQGCPRNLATLGKRAVAAGWAVDVRHRDMCHTLIISALVRTRDGSTEITVVAEWVDGRWNAGRSTVDGKTGLTKLSYAVVRDWIAEMTVIDRAAEAAGATYQGRTAQDWVVVAGGHAEAATRAYDRGVDVRDMLAHQRGSTYGPLNGTVLTGQQQALRAGSVPVWVDVAEEAIRAPFGRLDRRSVRAHDVECRAAAEIRAAGDEGVIPNARRAYELAERARVLADGCGADADAIESAALDAEAESVTALHVAAIEAQHAREESVWRTAHPDGDVREFARTVIETFNDADVRFAAWWEANARPGMTYWQGWDAMRRGHLTSAERQAQVDSREATDRAVIALGVAVAEHLRHTHTDDPDQVARTEELARVAARGSALGARPGMYERTDVASVVWTLLCGRPSWTGGLSLDMATNLADLDRWGTGAAAEARELRELFLLQHGLDVRGRAHAVVLAEIKAAEAVHRRVARAAYEAVKAAGGTDEAAREAAGDARARVEADTNGRE